jgi:hypothetical protein
LTDPSSDTAPATDQVSSIPAEATGQQTKDVTTPAASSTPEPPKGESSMLDAVKAAIKPKDAAPASQTPEKQADPADPAKPQETTSEEEKELSEDELKSLSARTQRRFRHLNSQVKTATALVEQLTPKAQEFDRLDNFVRSSGLSPTDVQGTLRIAADLRSDPHSAYQALLPIMQELQRIVGDVLPPELQQRVDAGLLHPEDALAFSRAAADAQVTRRRLDAQTLAQQETNRRQQRQDQLNTAVSSVESWEKQQASRDPDWHLKQPEVREQLELEVARKRLADPTWIPTTAESMKMTQDAYAKVQERMKRFVPRPTEVRPGPGGGGASPHSAPEPKTMLDAMRAALNR